MFISQIQKRRSIRKFSTEKVETEKIKLLVEAMLRSPSSRSFNPWQFVLVTDQDLLKKLAKSKPHGSSFLKNAALGIVVCADPEKTDTWIEDTSIATIMAQLAAESVELGSCWIQIRARNHNDTQSAQEYIAGILNIPANLKVESIVAVGYPDEKKPPHEKEDLQYEKIHLNTYGEPYRED
ncbi:MAG: NAD(P)H-dependent dehydrogenase/reductase [Proteobacteria bacterium]|nr:NAD(P)H-dependent dehydrogenase/reductase [Pseudomonadota bacterium]